MEIDWNNKKHEVNPCIHEVSIYETKEDYDKGEPFQLNVYSDLEEAKRDMENTINFNNYYSGNITNQLNGEKEYSFYLNQEEEEEL